MLIYLGDLYYDQHRAKGAVPLNVAYLAAYAKAHLGDAVQVVLFKSPGQLLDAIDHAPPDVLGLSNYIWNQRLSAFVARYARRQHPQIAVVMGGPNIRTDRDGMADFLRRHRDVDYYLPYAAEAAFTALLRAFNDRGTPDRWRGLEVPGCVTLDSEDRLVGAELIDPEMDLDYLPSPYLTGLLDPFLRDGYIPLFETNRGCPYHCTFCVWGISALGKIKRFSLERVEAELEYAARLGVPVPLWRLADANFGILKRDVTIAAKLRALHDASPSLFGYVDIWWAKNPTETMVEVARQLRELTTGYVAVQSFDDEVLREIKRSNISTDRLMAFATEIQPHVEGMHTDLLLGLPGETKSSHLASYRKALTMGFTSIGGGEVRMLPGSEMDTEESRTRYGLATKRRLCEGDVGYWRGELVYELEEGIRATKTMSEREMLELRVLRAVLYGCVTLGYLTPIVSAVRHLGLDLPDLLKLAVERAPPGGPLAQVVKRLTAVAHEEWFASEEAAHAYLARPEVAAGLGDRPPVKLNFWFIATMLWEAETGDDFLRSVEARMVDAGIAPWVAADLVALCRAANVLGAVLRGEAAAERVVALSPDTTTLLQASGYLTPGVGPEVRLRMAPTRLAGVEAWMAARAPIKVFDVALALGEFPGMLLRPARASD